ncbi:hypothetical protein [Tenacibaculum caenipelagi]|uniref:Uncharacterized protein n=1 Tax=Tenacibaculum caenipelagi TaxID=1325435 RepID=A0A4R6TCU1_9FLAO|nr:hypothetical protein [Tenacibaculum caenipelagi]TDQ27635.1 hypothetical protein DFQ07_1486 [Tenacibaculum caenipelagi]
MKTIQKIKITVRNGKEEKRETIGNPRPVVDNVAEELISKGEKATSEEELKKIKGLRILDIWEESEKEEEFNVDNANGDKLKKYAKENNIDLGEATKVADIREVVKEWINNLTVE